MLTVEKITQQNNVGELISSMMQQGYSFVREKRKNPDGTVVLEFKENSDKRQRLVD